jgi:DNA segregation ATPase FtsK/SpoIIIE-like protein
MFIDEATPVSATELGRRPGRYLASAAAGRRFVVSTNRVPSAAIISADDLRRLYALERGWDATAVEEVDAAGIDYRSLLSPGDPTITPIGVYGDGTAATLTVRSHHLIVGREHAGREDLLTSAILGAAISNPATELNFVLATGRSATGLPARLADLAHVVAEETDLIDPVALSRFAEQLSGELETRRALLSQHRARSFAELRCRQEAFDATGPGVPELVVVINDAAELLGYSYDCHKDLRDAIRQLAVAEDAFGLYLWLSSPTSLMHQVTDQLPSRVALQVLSTIDSREAIGVADAAKITKPGIGYTRLGIDATPRRFQVIAPADLDQVVAGAAPTLSHRVFGPTAEIAGRPRWAAGLPRSLAVGELVSRWEAEGGRRNTACVPIGLVDDPARHRHNVLCLDFANNPGIVTITGGNPDHITAAVATVIAAAYDTNTPETLQFVYLGPAYHTAAFPEFLLPNIRDLVSMGSSERVDATIEALLGRVTAGGPGARHLVLVVDGWRALVHERRERSDQIEYIARRGHAAGVHLVITTDASYYRFSDLKQLVGEMIELRLGELFLTQFDRDAAKLVPDDPHRALTKYGQLLLATS